MITIDSLTKKYGRTTVVDDVSFVARPGRVTGFLGPNGAGKSTTMRMVVGLTKPTSGSTAVSGRPFAELPNPSRELGVMLDASAQHAGRTGREILTVVQQMLGLPGRRVEMEPMTPVERKIVHEALKEDPEVETASEGTEPNRFVVVFPRAIAS